MGFMFMLLLTIVVIIIIATIHDILVEKEKTKRKELDIKETLIKKNLNDDLFKIRK